MAKNNEPNQKDLDDESTNPKTPKSKNLNPDTKVTFTIQQLAGIAVVVVGIIGSAGYAISEFRIMQLGISLLKDDVAEVKQTLKKPALVNIINNYDSTLRQNAKNLDYERRLLQLEANVFHTKSQKTQ